VTSTSKTDVVLIGAGIMSATLGALLRLVEPDWSITMIERLDGAAAESSDPWNNAGTGHSALCELNYTPERKDGSVDISKAVTINEQFHTSREFWNHLLTAGLMEGTDFINVTPHMTFVRGAENVDFLRRRHEALSVHPLFSDMEFSSDPAVIGTWAPLMTLDRDADEPIAATRAAAGTDVDFGSLTKKLVDLATAHNTELHLNHEVRGLKKLRDGRWRLNLRDRSWNAGTRRRTVTAKFVFVGAGGGALPLLQASGIKEARGYGGFPISGEFLRTAQPAIVSQHQAKVYGKADVGAPPMSVPHLDTRIVDGKSYLMFGPYAGFSPNYLKKGKYLGLITSLRLHNIGTMLGVAAKNMDLTGYLVGQVVAAPETKFHELQRFMPTAQPGDWEQITAGQRVQVMKWVKGKGGVLEFGTEVVAAQDGSIAGLLGASPGASTAVAAMTGLLERCFPARYDEWKPQLTSMMPSLGGVDYDTAQLTDVDQRVTAGA
jgi:malate dehydrogenase (quinone)